MTQTLTLASWNVNSLKVRLPQVLAWLGARDVQALVLQETKLTDEAFPVEAFTQLGYAVYFTGQKTYNGVALIAKQNAFERIDEVDLNLPGYPDEQKRLIAATLLPKNLPQDKSIRFVGGYFPNGMAPGSYKYLYKLDWLRALQRYLKTNLEKHSRLVLGGDFNIAPEDRDVWNPLSWKGNILVSEPERQAFRDLIALGLNDSFRALHPESGLYSWWDYRQRGFEQNHGLRIDHLLISDELMPSLLAAGIDTQPRSQPQPSDHAPITVSLRLD